LELVPHTIARKNVYMNVSPKTVFEAQPNMLTSLL